MRSLLPGRFIFLLFLCACTNDDKGNKDKATTSENDMDAARNFIRAALDGRYDDARTFIVPDSLNNQYLDAAARVYKDHLNREEKRGLQEAQIQFFNSRQPDSSTTIAVYANTYKHKRDSLKVVRLNGQWLVDFKYSFPRKDSALK